MTLIRITIFVCFLAFEVTSTIVDAQNITYQMMSQTYIKDRDNKGNLHRSLGRLRNPHSPKKPVERMDSVDGGEGPSTTGAVGTMGEPDLHDKTTLCKKIYQLREKIMPCPYEYTVFTQKVVEDNHPSKGWDAYLDFETLHPVYPSKSHIRPKLFPTVDGKCWYTDDIKLRGMLIAAWKSGGAMTGLSTDEFTIEMHNLQQSNPSNDVLNPKNKNGAIPLVRLIYRYPSACMVCKPVGGMKYLKQVRHCYSVHPKTYQAINRVSFHTHCGPCPPTCTDANVYVPHLIMIDR